MHNAIDPEDAPATTLAPASLAKHLGRRGTRVEGRRTRSRLLDCASRLFREHGLAAVSMTDIATSASAFPSQITYYFRSKEALFVEAACREVLYVAQRAEERASRQTTASGYTRALARAVMTTDALGFFAQAMLLARQRPDLAAQIERTVTRLHDEGARAYGQAISKHGWPAQDDAAVTARRFWALAIGVSLEGQAMGRTAQARIEELTRLTWGRASTLRGVATGGGKGTGE